MRRVTNLRLAHSRRRGFTLIEIMVALSGGLFFTIFVFMLTRDVSRFFQQESRLSDTTLSAISGFERLRADVARSGFLASPNLPKDPARCPPGDPGAPATGFGPNWAANAPLLMTMGLLRVEPDLALTNATLTLNAIVPDRLTLYGNFTSSEQFPARSVVPAGATTLVYLDPTSGAMSRVGFTTATDAAMQNRMDAIFPAGRALRLVNQEGEEQYGIIQSVTLGVAPLITLSTALPILAKGSGNVCGLRGLAGGVQVNTVNIIRYELADLKADARFAHVYSGEAPDADASRLELVRRELLPDGTEVVDSAELVTEYATDLRVGLSVVSNTALSTISFLPAGHADIPKYAGDPLTTAAGIGNGPHLIRGVHVRLSVRSTEGDREGAMTGVNAGPVPFRVQLPTAIGLPTKFARVRTLQALIATRNSRSKLWN